MNDEAAVEPQGESLIDSRMESDPSTHSQIVDDNTAMPSNGDKTMIPLSVAQKLREKKRELELELQWEKQERQRLLNQNSQKNLESDDNSQYESATREDLSRSQQESIRVIEERIWIKNNPEKYERINQDLENFLKQRPNLSSAISQASNRYEEAYTLMNALSPKQQQQLSKASIPKKEAPNAPGSVPKAAALNEAIDVMNMSDTEFSAWRASKKKSR